MPLPLPPPGTPGGFLAMEYVNPTAGERHSLRLHLAHFAEAAAGPENDHVYVAGGPVTPTETSVAQTYAALAVLWQPYYSPEWTLYCRSLGYNAGGTETLLLPAPIFPSYAGTDASDTTDSWFLDRRIRLLGRVGARRHLWLAQVPGTELRPQNVEVTPTSGGVDARDQAWVAYLSGASGGGAVMPDGTYCFAVTDMQVWWARRPEAASWVTPGAPYVVSGP